MCPWLLYPPLYPPRSPQCARRTLCPAASETCAFAFLLLSPNSPSLATNNFKKVVISVLPKLIPAVTACLEGTTSADGASSGPPPQAVAAGALGALEALVFLLRSTMRPHVKKVEAATALWLQVRAWSALASKQAESRALQSEPRFEALRRHSAIRSAYHSDGSSCCGHGVRHALCTIFYDTQIMKPSLEDEIVSATHRLALKLNSALTDCPGRLCCSGSLFPVETSFRGPVI